MGQRDILLEVASACTSCHVPFLLTGSFAVSFYGYPRATHDIDIIIEIDASIPSKIESILKSLGSSYVFDRNNIRSNQKTNYQLNVYHKDEATKIDFWIINASEFQQKYQRKITMTLEKTVIPLISAEDLILNKLLWCKTVMSDRHMRDCVGIWKVQGDKLDKNYIQQQAIRMNISVLLSQIVDKQY